MVDAVTDKVTTTKIERVIESFEDLANAVIDGRATSSRARRSEINAAMDAVREARAELATSLREFLQPRLNLMQGGRQQDDADENPVVCRRCGERTICADSNCPHWHAAIRDKLAVDKATREITERAIVIGHEPPEPPRAA